MSLNNLSMSLNNLSITHIIIHITNIRNINIILMVLIVKSIMYLR